MKELPALDISDLTTAQLAERTGMPAGTLRMWETRHRFPEPARLPSGHRRYSAQDVDAVREAIRLREQGLSLSAAIDRVRAPRRRPPASIFAAVRERRPDLQPAVLTKRALLELTRAIEDEYCARSASGVLIGSFQRARFYRQAQRRWRELARTATLAVVFADFKAARGRRGNPMEVPIAREHPLAREWTLVIDAPRAQACVAAWEQPASSDLPDRYRRFEVLWSPEPEVVRTATTLAAELLGALAPALARALSGAIHEPLVASPPELRYAAALAHRMVGYLGAQIDAPRRRP